MLTNRCSKNLSIILKNHGFPQASIEFDSDYYNEDGKLIYNREKELENKSELIFAPYICEVIDRFELDLDLYLSVNYNNSCYTYRIYDPTENVEILSDSKENIELSSKAYELCIMKAIEYYEKKKRKR